MVNSGNLFCIQDNSQKKMESNSPPKFLDLRTVCRKWCLVLAFNSNTFWNLLLLLLLLLL